MYVSVQRFYEALQASAFDGRHEEKLRLFSGLLLNYLICQWTKLI